MSLGQAPRLLLSVIPTKANQDYGDQKPIRMLSDGAQQPVGIEETEWMTFRLGLDV